MIWHVSWRYGHITLVSRYCLTPVNDNNMDVYYQVKNRLRAPTLARKLDISHFGLPVVRTDGWMGVWLVDHAINKIFQIDRLPNCVRYGLHSHART